MFLLQKTISSDLQCYVLYTPAGDWNEVMVQKHLIENCTVHALDVMGLNPSQIKLGVCSTSVYVILGPKLKCRPMHKPKSKTMNKM